MNTEGQLHFWSYANGEVERQNRHLLKVIKIIKAQGENLQSGLNKYLMAHRTTPHSTTGVSPVELMYGRKVRTNVPELSEISSNLEVQYGDNEMIQKYKDCR